MKDLLDEEHCCCKIYTSLMESSAPPFYRRPFLYGSHQPFFKKILTHPSVIFQKSQPPYTLPQVQFTDMPLLKATSSSSPGSVSIAIFMISTLNMSYVMNYLKDTSATKR